MNKKILLIPIILVVILLSFSFFDDNDDSNIVFHVTLADPTLFENGIYTEEITLHDGEYGFQFVPNGDSPQILSISIRGDTIDFSEDFMLVGTLHRTDISEYYTWEYSGQSTISVTEQNALVTINPHGNVQGPVSVFIVKN